MLRIRLRRVGKKKAPAYRIVVADSRAPRDGKFVEILGLYDPLTEPVTVTVNGDRVREWVGKGAQPSDTVARLMRNAGVLQGPEPRRHPGAAAVAETPAAVAAAPAASATASETVAETAPTADASTTADAAADEATAEPS